MGHYCDMIRVLAGLAAWLGGTALAVSLAWLGAGMVVRSTTASPSLPPVATALPAASSRPAPGAPPPARPAPSSAPPAARGPRPRCEPDRVPGARRHRARL